MAEFINNYIYENEPFYNQNLKIALTDNKVKNQTKNYPKKINVAKDILQLKQRREEHNKKIEQKIYQKMDDDFNFLIQKKKFQVEYQKPQQYKTSKDSKIFVCVRKRPIFQKELMDGEIDCISAINPKVYIYECKIKIDGYTKYIDTNEFKFDNAFNENDSTMLVYNCTIQPSLDILLRGGVVTCFAYGQTGSGKTYTMVGIQDIAINNIFQIFQNLGRRTNKIFTFYVSFFEIYLGLLYDLLNNRNKVQALEDKNQRVQIYGLTEQRVTSPEELKSIIDFANTVRTTHNTVTNETSSRSHAVCNFVIKIQNNNYEKEYAKLSLVDLAGSERATETQSNDKNRLAEGADINKSLLALKECIRALDAKKKGNTEQHVPFRNSKLTLVLRDSFLGKADLCKIIMISCISPSNHSSNHTINTLRYSMRLKEKIPNNSYNKINYNAQGQINSKKNYMINLNKNKKISKSPNIKRNISKNREKFHIIDNKSNLNKFHYSNGNVNSSSENNKNKKEPKTNKNLILLEGTKSNNKNINTQKNQNLKNKPINNRYLEKKNTNSHLNKKSKNSLSTNIKKGEKYKFSNVVKKKIFTRSQTSSSKINKPKGFKIKNSSEITQNQKINNTISNPLKYYPSYQGNLQIQNYQKEYNSYNYDYQNNRNIDLNIDIDPGKGLMYDQIDVINSQQKYLTEDGNLINKFKGLTKDNVGKQIYAPVIENIIQSKMNYLNQLQDNIIEYKKLIYNYKK